MRLRQSTTATPQWARAGLRHAGENNHLPVKTKCADQSIKSLHSAPTEHQLRDTLRRVRVWNVLILNNLLPRKIAKNNTSPPLPINSARA